MVAGVLIGAVTIEGVDAVLAPRHAEVGLAPPHEHIPEREGDPIVYLSNVSIGASATATASTVVAASAGGVVTQFSWAKYWDSVRFDTNPAGLLTAVGFVVINPDAWSDAATSTG